MILLSQHGDHSLIRYVSCKGSTWIVCKMLITLVYQSQVLTTKVLVYSFKNKMFENKHFQKKINNHHLY